MTQTDTPRRLALLTPYDAARLGLLRSGFGVDELIDHERTVAELEAAAFLVIEDPPGGDALATAGGHVGAAGLRRAVAAQLTDPGGAGPDGVGIGDLTWIVRATWNGAPIPDPEVERLARVAAARVDQTGGAP